MKSILVVDDERNIVELLRIYLEKEGFGVAAATDGEQALALHKRHDPDLVILDLMLPKVDGYEVCREIRRRGGRGGNGSCRGRRAGRKGHGGPGPKPIDHRAHRGASVRTSVDRGP